MDKIVILAIFALAAISLFGYFLDMFFAEWRARIHDKWNERRAEQKKKAEEAKKKAEAEKYSRVYQGNPILNAMTDPHNVIVDGGLGAGKTLICNLFTKYTCDKYEIEDARNRRYNKYMRKGYQKEMDDLRKRKKLRVYANIKLEDAQTGFTSEEFWPYLFQHKRCVENGIFFTDEFGTNLGKDLWNQQQQEKDADIERAINMARFARQNRNIKWFGTEQDGNNIFKPIRDKGFLQITALRTRKRISRWGKLKRWCYTWFARLAPGWLVLNFHEELAKERRQQRKWLKALIMLLPCVYFTMPANYYKAITIFGQKIKDKHMWFQTIVRMGDREFMFRFTQKDIFKYNSRGNEVVYDSQFDEEGNRIWNKTEQKYHQLAS